MNLSSQKGYVKAIFTQNCDPKVYIAIWIAYFSCFTLGASLYFLDFLKKSCVALYLVN